MTGTNGSIPRCVECGKHPQADCWTVCMSCLQWALDEGWPIGEYKVRR
jgi:hypothetical protein